MDRCTLRIAGSCLLWLPFAAACPTDTAATGEAGTTADPDTGAASTTGGPDPSDGSSTSTTTTNDPSTSSSSTADSTTSEGSSSTGVEGCGDGHVDLQAGEACDGDNLDGRDCTDQGFAGGVLACNPDCTLDTSGCSTVCGDAEIQGAEDCEGNDLGGATCQSEGFDGGDLGCTPACSYDTTACENYICGDGVVAGPEACDGLQLAGEDCVSAGFDGGMLVCADDCAAVDTSGCFVCGDGIINGAEACDGAALGGETCVSQGADGGVLSCNDDCTFDVSACVGCGNGDADPGEQCDGSDLGGITCGLLGFFAGGLPTCRPDCTISDVGCAGLHTFCASPDAAIGPGPGLTTSSIPVDGLAGEVIDVDVYAAATHSRVSDLVIDLRHVSSDLTTSLASGQCGVASDIDATFDQDAGLPPDCVEPIAIEGNVLPLGDLDAYVSNAAVGAGNGAWELNITDQAAGEGGVLAQWCVAITTGNLDCPNGELDVGEMCDDLAPSAFEHVGCTQCVYDFSQVHQLYCNGSCSWAGADDCDQADADIYCKLVTGDPTSTATDFDIGIALDEYGFSCPGYGTDLGTLANSGVDVDVWYQDTSILANHGAGLVVTNVTCN